MYPTRDDSGDARSPPYATQFENLCKLANKLFIKVDGDQRKSPFPNKQHNIPAVPADAAYEGGSVDEYAMPIAAISTKTAYIDPRDKIDFLPRVVFNDILPLISAYARKIWAPRHDETYIFLTEETRISPREKYRRLACYGVYCAAADAALETSMATICSTTATGVGRGHALDVHNAAVQTHKAVTHAVESRLTYVRRFKGKKTLTREERVAERLIYSRFFDTQAADRNTNGVNGFIASLEDKRIEVSLHAAAKARAAQTFKEHTPGRGDGGNADKLTPRDRTRISRTKDKGTGRRERREG
jgi:hypothetical protein